MTTAFAAIGAPERHSASNASEGVGRTVIGTVNSPKTASHRRSPGEGFS
jgi:hypothetical protein